MKKTILIGLMLLMSIFVYAITQEQVNNIDFDTVNLNCVWLGSEVTINRNNLIVPFACDSIKKEYIIDEEDSIWTGDYLVFRQKFRTDYPTADIIICLRTNTTDQCIINKIRPELMLQARDKISEHRQNLKRFQNPDIPDIDGDNLGLDGTVGD
jgi:hypothetical protein